MDALKLRKDVNKAGLLQAVRTVFDQVADPVSDRKFSIGACLMSGLAVFLEKHAALLPFDLSICARDTVVEANLRRLYGLEQVPCDTALPPSPDPVSPVHIRRAFQQVLQRAQRGKYQKEDVVHNKRSLLHLG